ncbi:uncharacterized protein LOC127248215 [Andrographis paniculata]|uniref:uncharacterized protein LOC127248215 n=1 Tax=Andrographis paniculata TaxID=175694 RepID=UPI0021E702AD|nr:uncharacterized protein LOC127248215 [Andrographis paniculata]
MLNERAQALSSAGDGSIDILELSRSRDVRMEAKEDPDATEYSSSFGDTTSGNENTSGLSETEVESQFVGDSDLVPQFDEFGSMFPRRKKKLSAHWRNFIQPLMWRCKWTELKIKELESQASKYTREVSIKYGKNHLALDQALVEQSGSKLLPFTHQSRRKKPMKRRKRKRVEDTTDIASYMLNHILFSDRENKKSGPDIVPKLENLGNSDQAMAGVDEFETQDTLITQDSDNALEQILRRIELVHSRVHNLKSQLDSVMSKNAPKFSSSENLSQLMACDAQTSSGCSPTFSACNGDTISAAGLDYDLGDFTMPDSFIGEAIPIPDIIESTVGLLSSVDVTHHQAQAGDSSEKIVDNILVHNEVEASTFECNPSLAFEKTHEAEMSAEEESNNTILEQPALKSGLASGIHFPKNKRKRGERKAGSGNWSRQRPGEQEN